MYADASSAEASISYARNQHGAAEAEFEFVARHIDGRAVLYGRYIGEAETGQEEQATTS